VWERHGFHVTPVHFYQPIPDTQALPETLWNRPSELVGVDMNEPVQLDLLRLKPGVIVHVHDIFFPFDYRRDWVMDELRFWSEQYLLQAFLSFNSEFEVLMANGYLAHRYMEDFKASFINSPWWGGGSFECAGGLPKQTDCLPPKYYSFPRIGLIGHVRSP
jgi:hypothetical protein